MGTSDLTLFHGPSARHAHACVELRFPLPEAGFRAASAEDALARHAIKLLGTLPDASLPLDAAAWHVARAILERTAPWWSGHGSGDGHGWIAAGHPHPYIAGLTMEVAVELLRDGSEGGEGGEAVARKLEFLAGWFDKVDKARLWIIAAADARGQDFANVNKTTTLYQIGQGAKGLHFHLTSNERDALTGRMLESNKYLTVETLQRHGLPTSPGKLADSGDDAARAATELGLPCVVKPVAMGRGAGVATRLESAAHVAEAAVRALELSGRNVLVEKHVEGDDHRLMVCEGQLLWAYRRHPASVVGDGTASVRQLVEREDRRRAAVRDASEAYLYPIGVDEALAEFVERRHGLALDAVPEAGRRIEVAAQANVARGGVLEDVTGSLHPDNRALAIRVSRLFRIRTIGIDFISPDISRSWKDVPCAIIEVNRTPAIWGTGDAALLLRSLFPGRRSGLIPMIVIVGDANYRARMLAPVEAAVTEAGLRLATALYAKPAVGRGRLSHAGPAEAIETLLLDPEADVGAVLCEVAQVARTGFPLRRCDLLLIQHPDRLAWAAPLAGRVLPGEAAADEIAGALTDVLAAEARGDDAPAPVLEPAEAESDTAFGLTVWRAPALPRAAFWRDVGATAPRDSGATTHEDLLAAVTALAAQRLGKAGALPRGFAHPDLPGPWACASFKASLALPPANAAPARRALTEAVERVNAIVAADRRRR